MNKIRLTPKPAKFSAAHSLPCLGYPCCNKHGHTWIVQATFEGEPNADGVLVPYEVVREVVGELDHQDLDDLLDFPATGELLTLHLVGRMRQRLEAWPNARLVRVELQEDPAPVPHVVVWASEGGEG